MKEQVKIILATDDEAASPVTMQLWKSRTGTYFLTEESARQDGATHEKCACGDTFDKRYYYTTCESCRSRQREFFALEKYNRMPLKEWDGKTPIYSDKWEKYFFDEDGLICELEDHEKGIDPRLIICEPEFPSDVSDDYWEDQYPEDMGFEDVASNKVQEALEALNKALAEEKPWAWHPGQFRTEYKAELDTDND